MLSANRRFYEAFERQDLDAMSELWSHREDVACTHPGWATLHGWSAVAASWFTLFQQPAPVQFILTGERARVSGDTGWVTVDENLIGEGIGGTVAAVNLFHCTAEGWRMVCHHGSGVAGS